MKHVRKPLSQKSIDEILASRETVKPTASKDDVDMDDKGEQPENGDELKPETEKPRERERGEGREWKRNGMRGLIHGRFNINNWFR